MSSENLRISSVQRPGWAPSEGRVPRIGHFVYCVEGPAKVVKLLGRTSDGSRLLELKCEDRRAPFFASSSNVLMQAQTPDFAEPPQALEDGSEP